jgi:hypothetical protein
MILVNIFIQIITTLTIAITSQTDRMPVSNNLSYRFAYDQRSGVIFDLSQEKNEEV